MSEFDRLAGELQVHLEELVAATLQRLGERVPDWTLESSFAQDRVSAFARGSVEEQLRSFRLGVLPKQCPEVDASGAVTVAKVGELRILLNGYWACQVSLWDAWLELVENSVSDSRERRELLRRGSDFFFRYAGLLSDYVAHVYQRELERSPQNAESRRLQAIRSVLEGDSIAVSSADLGLDLNQHHLGLIAWGEQGSGAARELAGALQRPLLISGPLNGAWWGWISGSRPFGDAEERALRRFKPPAAAHLALGVGAFGEQGFRATHRQAQRARWAGRYSDSALVRYADVAVESLASENPDEARLFVARELRGIEDDSATSQRIRETLVAYFEAEHNAASAAARLGVHQQTVANRLRTVEERLGHSVGARRVELELALRLRASLDGEPS